ncbi:SidA/IucD/PvdA family monooxygenase [Streptomyces sp. NPDC001832]|uniref:SidA/IucD/PvdA family monooxygenase n=1 Tax=Streptomyces sp. NPDC001832 TaxID=3154527 RepID=UPI0033262401
MAWHPGLLWSDSRLQVSALKDLVTLVDPTGRPARGGQAEVGRTFIGGFRSRPSRGGRFSSGRVASARARRRRLRPARRAPPRRKLMDNPVAGRRLPDYVGHDEVV